MHRPHSLTAKPSVKLPLAGQPDAAATIERLQQEIERLSLQLDSQNSSKPPSSDSYSRNLKKQKMSEDKTTEPKRKPGGQPGPGKTRTRVWLTALILRPQECSHCGSHDFVEQPVGPASSPVGSQSD